MDSEGYITYAIGHKLSNVKDEPIAAYSHMWITREDAEELLTSDLRKVFGSIGLSSFAVSYEELSNDRQIIIESMVYQMGASGIEKFKLMWKDISNGDFRGASTEMLDSKWAKQTPSRARRLAEAMEYGDLKNVYGSYLS